MFLKDRIYQTTSQASPLFQCTPSLAGCEGVGDGGYAALAKKLPQTLSLPFKRMRGTCCGQLLYRRNWNMNLFEDVFLIQNEGFSHLRQVKTSDING